MLLSFLHLVTKEGLHDMHIHACSYHVYLVVVLEDAYTEEEGEEKLVLLEERAADITVQTEGEILIDIGNPLLQIIYGDKE